MQEIMKMIQKIKGDKCKIMQIEEMAKCRQGWVGEHKVDAIRDIWFYLRGLLERENLRAEHTHCVCRKKK